MKVIDELKSHLYNYIFLTEYSHRIREEYQLISEADILYSRFYWFAKFKKGYSRQFGEDASQEQQAYKITEEIHMILGEKTDWSFIDQGVDSHD